MAERVTQESIIVEFEGEGVRTTQQSVIMEFEGSGVRATEASILVEFEARELRATGFYIIIEHEIQVVDFYAVYPGHDAPATLLERLDPQPQVSGIEITRRSFGHNRKLLDEFLFCYLKYNVVGSYTIYRSILDQLNILDNDESDVTITLKSKEGLEWGRYNGRVVKPQLGEDIRPERFFLRDLQILVKHLTKLS